MLLQNLYTEQYRQNKYFYNKYSPPEQAANTKSSVIFGKLLNLGSCHHVDGLWSCGGVLVKMMVALWWKHMLASTVH